MKSWTFIIGIAVAIILTLIWIFLLFSNDQEQGGIFNDFGFGDTTDTSVGPVAETPVVESDTAIEDSPLQQLTTKKVIGYLELPSEAASSTVVRFVEGGTGHVFSLDVVTGEETRVSNITIPVATLAAISPDGQYAAIMDESAVLTLVRLSGQDSSSVISTLEAINSFTFSAEGELLYTTHTNTSTLGRSYDVQTLTSRPLFEIPFREATVVWGTSGAGVHYAYPKAASGLEGYLYAIDSGVLERLPISGFGLTALSDVNYVLFARQSEGAYRTQVYHLTRETTRTLPFTFLPEKCTLTSDIGTLLCAQTRTSYDENVPDTWHKGELSYADELWSVDVTSGSVSPLFDVSSVAGRDIDIMTLTTGQDAARVYFINKNDQALWLYDQTIPESAS